MKEININEIDKIKNPYILDIREKEELLQTGTIKGAVHIPMKKIPGSLNKIPKDKEIYVFCRSGRRSGIISKMLGQLGYNVINLSGGIIKYKGKLEKINLG